MKKIALGGGGILVLLWAVAFLGILPSQLVKAQDIPFTSSPADVGLGYEDVSVPVPDEGLSLSGWWMPAQDATSVVLFIHGGNANKEDFYFGALDYYAELVALGHHVLAIDLRNHGASDRTESGRLAFGQEEHRDVSAALSLIEELAPGLPIIGSGVSMGGATLIEAAARDRRLQALVLIDPLLDPESATLGAMLALTGLPKALLVPTYWSAATFFDVRGDESRPRDTGAALTIPVLVIQDPNDPVTRAEFALELAKASPNVSCHLVPPAPADHPVILESAGWGSHGGAFRIHKEETMDRVVRFLATL